MSKKEKSNYSFETSLPAYEKDQLGKDFQAKRILEVMRSLGGRCTLKHIQEITGLPQSTVSGRMSDLRESKDVVDSGDKIVYKEMKRKVFQIIEQAPKQAPKGKPAPLFNYKKSSI